MQLKLAKQNTRTASPANRSSRPNICTSRKPRKTPDNPLFTRKVTNLYCWTHGGCAHDSQACNAKALGHKSDETFENKMGGSKAFCPWRCETKDDHRRVTILTNAISLSRKPLSSSVVSHTSNKTFLPKANVILAKGDSAASDHYFRLHDRTCLHNIRPTTSSPIILPNKSTITASHTGELPLHPSLSQQGKTAKILPKLTSASLISIGKLCDYNCIVTFDKSQMCVYKHNQQIM